MPTLTDILQESTEEDVIQSRNTLNDILKEPVLPATKLTRPHERTIGDTVKDVGVSLAHGVVDLAEAGVGIGDFFLDGEYGNMVEELGIYKPKKWHKSLDENYSPAQIEANRKVNEAKGFVDTTEAMLENPSTIAHKFVRTLPSTVGGSFAGAGAGALRFGGKQLPKLMRPAFGEGLLEMGSKGESIRQETGGITNKQKLIAAASGIGTGVFGYFGAKFAKKSGFDDLDSLLAGLGVNKKPAHVTAKIVGGGISEGVFEELPQSAQETIWMNAALDKPLTEGLGKNIAEGLIVGAAGGSGVNVATSIHDVAKKGRGDGDNGESNTNDTSPDRTTDAPIEDSAQNEINNIQQTKIEESAKIDEQFEGAPPTMIQGAKDVLDDVSEIKTQDVLSRTAQKAEENGLAPTAQAETQGWIDDDGNVLGRVAQATSGNNGTHEFNQHNILKLSLIHI